MENFSEELEIFEETETITKFSVIVKKTYKISKTSTKIEGLSVHFYCKDKSNSRKRCLGERENKSRKEEERRPNGEPNYQMAETLQQGQVPDGNEMMNQDVIYGNRTAPNFENEVIVTIIEHIEPAVISQENKIINENHDNKWDDEDIEVAQILLQLSQGKAYSEEAKTGKS